jgi:hypothetical protein
VAAAQHLHAHAWGPLHILHHIEKRHDPKACTFASCDLQLLYNQGFISSFGEATLSPNRYHQPMYILHVGVDSPRLRLQMLAAVGADCLVLHGKDLAYNKGTQTLARLGQKLTLNLSS